MSSKPQPITVEVEYVPDEEGYVHAVALLVSYCRHDRDLDVVQSPTWHPDSPRSSAHATTH